MVEGGGVLWVQCWEWKKREKKKNGSRIYDKAKGSCEEEGDWDEGVRPRGGRWRTERVGLEPGVVPQQGIKHMEGKPPLGCFSFPFFKGFGQHHVVAILGVAADGRHRDTFGLGLCLFSSPTASLARRPMMGYRGRPPGSVPSSCDGAVFLPLPSFSSAS